MTLRYLLPQGLWWVLTIYTIYIYTIYIFQGSVTASCITMPLTTAFTRLQLEDKRQAKGPITTMIELVSQTSKLVSHYNVFQVRDEGFLTLYRGCQSTLLSISISNFVYFYSFHGLKKFTGAASQNALKDLLFACTAGCHEDKTGRHTVLLFQDASMFF